MPKVQLLSDLHFEFDRDRGEAFAQSVPVAGDVLVLAGDILQLRRPPEVERMLGWFCSRFPHVIYVLGNHEYYKSTPAGAEALLAEIAQRFPNLHILGPGVVTIDGVRFLGGTLWFPPTPDEELYRHLLVDFQLIEGILPWVHETHAAHLAFLRANLRPGDVVVTHHMPHPGSIAQQFKDSPLNRFFVADDAADLVERGGAALWIHGHGHVACDYVAGGTRVICNPRGYPNEPGIVPIDVGLVVTV